MFYCTAGKEVKARKLQEEGDFVLRDLWLNHIQCCEVYGKVVLRMNVESLCDCSSVLMMFKCGVRTIPSHSFGITICMLSISGYRPRLLETEECAVQTDSRLNVFLRSEQSVSDRTTKSTLFPRNLLHKLQSTALTHLAVQPPSPFVEP